MPTFYVPDDAENPLTKLMLRAVPPNEYGNQTITHLAQLMKLTRAALYKWIDQQKLPPERVMQIVEISRIKRFDKNGKPVLGEARVRREEFDEFVYKAT